MKSIFIAIFVLGNLLSLNAAAATIQPEVVQLGVCSKDKVKMNRSFACGKALHTMLIRVSNTGIHPVDVFVNSKLAGFKRLPAKGFAEHFFLKKGDTIKVGRADKEWSRRSLEITVVDILAVD